MLSEVWTFTVGCKKEKPEAGSFRELKYSDDGGYLTTGSLLRIAIDNSYGVQAMNYTISDLSERENKIKRLPAVQLQMGTNNITIDLNKISGIEEDHEYLLTVILPGGKKVSVRFKYQEN